MVQGRLREAASMVYLSIIIPAYNEEKRVYATLTRAINYLSNKNYAYEIIVVDDGSTDGTPDIIKTIINDKVVIIRNPVNQGKGSSVRRGVLASCGEIILFSDADLSADIAEMDKLLPWLNKGYDVVIGSRAAADSTIGLRQPWHRVLMGKTFNLLVRAFILKGFRDTQCGFKCFKRDAAMKIFNLQRLSGFAFDVETLFIADRLGFKIKEAGVVWKNSPESKVHLVKGSLSMLLDLFKIRFYHGKIRAGLR